MYRTDVSFYRIDFIEVYRNDQIPVSAYIYRGTEKEQRLTSDCCMYFTKRSHCRSSLIACNLIHTLPIKRLFNERFVTSLHCNTYTRHETEEFKFKRMQSSVVERFRKSIFQTNPAASQKLSKKRQEMKANVCKELTCWIVLRCA